MHIGRLGASYVLLFLFEAAEYYTRGMHGAEVATTFDWSNPSAGEAHEADNQHPQERSFPLFVFM